MLNAISNLRVYFKMKIALVKAETGDAISWRVTLIRFTSFRGNTCYAQSTSIMILDL